MCAKEVSEKIVSFNDNRVKDIEELFSFHAPRLLKLANVICCPNCKNVIFREGESLICRECVKVYPIKKRHLYFIEPPKRSNNSDQLKGKLKNLLGNYHSILTHIVAPTFPYSFASKLRNWVDFSSGIFLDVGAGGTRINEDVISIDTFDFDQVDIVCDIHALPFADDTLSGVVSRSVLEHLSQPWIATQEFTRCLKLGGIQVHAVPFIYPFHGSPHDYFRFSIMGMRTLLNPLQIVHQENLTGPVSSFLALLTHTIGTIAGPENSYLRMLALIISSVLLCPFKMIDYIFINSPRFQEVAATHLTVARKV